MAQSKGLSKMQGEKFFEAMLMVKYGKKWKLTFFSTKKVVVFVQKCRFSAKTSVKSLKNEK